VFANWSGIEVASAGLNSDADNPVTLELIQWAEIIFVMERTHRAKLSKKYRASLNGKRIVCLDIPDDYEFMDSRLIRLLKARVPKYLPRL
jgi:predicted protein tyrosine phosphatase